MKNNTLGPSNLKILEWKNQFSDPQNIENISMEISVLGKSSFSKNADSSRAGKILQ